MYACIYTTMMFFFSVNPPFASIFASFFPPLPDPTLLVYLLGDPASFACCVNTHSLLSLVSYQLFSPCYFTHHKHPTDQVTYLHRRHQQHQSTRLIHIFCIEKSYCDHALKKVSCKWTYSVAWRKSAWCWDEWSQGPVLKNVTYFLILIKLLTPQTK